MNTTTTTTDDRTYDYLEPFREHDEFRMANWIETRSWQTLFWFSFLLLCGGSIVVALCYLL